VHFLEQEQNVNFYILLNTSKSKFFVVIMIHRFVKPPFFRPLNLTVW